MDKSDGHFDKGRWVKDENPPDKTSVTEDYHEIEERLKAAVTQVGRGIDELLGAGSDLIGSQEGRQLLGRKLDNVTGEIITSFEEIRKEGINILNLAKDRIFK